MWLVYKKELLELLRDRKTLFFVIALPLIVFPIIFGIMGLVMANTQLNEEKKVHRYVLVGGEQFPEFAKDLRYHKSFKRVTTGLNDQKSLIEGIQNDQFDVAIIIPADHTEQVQQNQQSQWQVIFNDASATSRIYGRVKDLIDKHAKQLQTAKIEALGVPVAQQEALLQPIVISKIDTADKRENLGEKLGGIIPYLLIPLCLVGAAYPAIDLGAGEKERGTLETLLLTPIPRTFLVLGKFLTILTTAILSTLLTVGSMGFWAMLMGSMMDMKPIQEAFVGIGMAELLMILLLLIPLAGIFAALLLAISIYARSFKEAQNYMAPLNMVIFIPLLMAVVPGSTLSWKTALVPVMNVALSIKEILKGTMTAGLFTTTLTAQLVLAAIIITLSVRWFNREAVLFR